MSLDPTDSCTFWYVNEYYATQANGSSGNWQTRIGSFKFPSCGGLLPTSTTLTSSLNPSNLGDSVTLTATVTGSDPSGSVLFSDSLTGNLSGCLFLIPLSGSGNTKTAQCTTSSLIEGAHVILADYQGDTANLGSVSNAVSQVVNGAGGTSTNAALASAGATALASSTFSSAFPVSAIIDGDRAGLNFGAGGVWKDGTAGAWPDWVEIDFNGSQTIDRVIVYSVQDNDLSPVDPDDSLTFTRRGATAFDVQTWNGSAWVTQGSVTGNDLVKRTISFPATTTTKIRVSIDAVKSGKYSFLTEVEAWTAGTVPPPPATTLAASPNPVRINKTVTFTATVTAANPTGSVTFTSNGNAIAGCGAVAMSGSGNTKTALCATSFATTGVYGIVAAYSGDGTNAPTVSKTLAETVKKR